LNYTRLTDDAEARNSDHILTNAAGLDSGPVLVEGVGFEPTKA
jgi:hypothetical protein